jgi:oligogalacturonide lyase
MRMIAAEARGAAFPPDARKYADAATDLEVYRLTDASYSSTLPAWYNRSFTRGGGELLFCCDRAGAPQAFLMELRNAETHQLTEAEDLDGDSLSLAAADRSFCYFAGRSLRVSVLATLLERELYGIEEGWERGAGSSVDREGLQAYFVERRGDGARLRTVALSNGKARTVLEGPAGIAEPIARPGRPQVLYRQGDQALWLAAIEGKGGNRRLKLADGRIGPANWSPDGKTILYLHFPADPAQLNAIREYTPETDSDALVAGTSQFVNFGFNRDTSVFVGASRNTASPVVLILLRTTRRDLTLCEHRASHPETVAPRFSPDSQKIYFQSDRDGKPAIFGLTVDRLVEKTEADTL